MNICENHDKCMSEILGGIDDLNGKMDSVVLTVRSFDKTAAVNEARLLDHIGNKFIHISSWYAVAIIIAGTIAGAIAGAK